MQTPDPTIFAIDNDQPFLRSLSEMFAPIGLTSHFFGSGDEFFRQFDPAIPGCLILELNIPGLSGLEIQERLAREPVAPPLIFVAAHVDAATRARVKRLGAVDILHKQLFSENDLWESVFNAISRDRDNRRAFDRQKARLARLSELTESERQVLNLILSGESILHIADALGLSRRAVEIRRSRLMRKLGVSTLTELLGFGIGAGLC